MIRRYESGGLVTVGYVVIIVISHKEMLVKLRAGKKG